MKKILFVCLGNICRSPMAEFMFKDILEKSNMSELYHVESRGTCNDEIGNSIYSLARKELEKHNVKIGYKVAKLITKEDYDSYDYIIVMEEQNRKNIKKLLKLDNDNKIYRLLDFSNDKRDILDPWYTRDFEKAYSDIDLGLKAFFKYLNGDSND